MRENEAMIYLLRGITFLVIGVGLVGLGLVWLNDGTPLFFIPLLAAPPIVVAGVTMLGRRATRRPKSNA